MCLKLSKLFKNHLNHLKLVKPSKFPNLGLFRNIWGRVSLAFWCPVLMNNHRWSYQDLGHLLHIGWGIVGVITSVAADVLVPCVPKSSWGILGQLYTRSLSQGIPDFGWPKMWCHWSLQMQLQCYVLTVHLFVVMTIVWFLFLMSRLRLMLIPFLRYMYILCIVCYGKLAW